MIAGLALLLTGAVAHPFACLDYVQGKVFIFSGQGALEWEHPAPQGDDLWILPNGNLLVTVGHGVREVTRQGQIVLNYESASEIYACQRLPKGQTFVGECNSGRLLHLDRSGNVIDEVRLLPAGVDGGHVYMRNARQLTNGNYLVPHYGADAVREYDSHGRQLREIPAAGGPHTAVRLPNGNTLIACGDRPGGPRVIEVAADNQIVWQVTADELPGIRLKFMAGLQRLPNGNTVMSNWLGHGHLGAGPHLVEVTPDKQVVWTFADHQRVKTIASFQLLDVPGDATQGELWR
jgi:hypothetical protein